MTTGDVARGVAYVLAGALVGCVVGAVFRVGCGPLIGAAMGLAWSVRD